MTDDDIARAVDGVYGFYPSVHRLAGENENYLIERDDGTKYVLKIAPEGFERERILLEHAAVEAVFAWGTGVALPRLVAGSNGNIVATFSSGHGAFRLGRLLEFVAGDPWCERSPASSALLTCLGELVARIAGALASVHLPAAAATHHWDLARAGAHRIDTHCVGDRNRRRLLARQFERWAAGVQDLKTVPHGLIHGDLNDDNLLVSNGKISGVLDFGDTLDNPLICDLAIAMAYILLDEPDPWHAGARMVAGYHAIRPLSATEIELLYPLICARLSVSLITSAKRRQIDPDRTAWFVTEKRAWSFLERYGDCSPTDVADRWAALIDVRAYPDRGIPKAELLARRRAITSSAQLISYNDPIKFIRGRGAYLIDVRGRPFLDLYNNVCHVGHCHPHVVQAGQKQMAQLNTNTRYLTDLHVNYAERLAALLPESLDTVFFVNSGSEANELALRLACTHTGNEDVVVVENAYHGHTRKLIDVSPYKFMGRGGRGRAEPWVHVVPVPDGFRGRHKGQTRDTGIAYGDAVGETIRAAGRPIAAFMAETLLSCGGQVIPPPGYFDTVFRHVRDSGGVCVLDEVQVGFGRIGSHFWAFDAYDVVPDIVVVGKPIGNGHPMAAVICTRQIARSFEATGMEYFATFGGNPVSCAIGNAVLDVIDREGLQEHARKTGRYFLEALRRLEKRYACIGDVRGVGLFLGIDLVQDDGITPATGLAADVVDALRKENILTGTDGPYGNVIKIKPPMVINDGDVDRFVLDLEAVLDDRFPEAG